MAGADVLCLCVSALSCMVGDGRVGYEGAIAPHGDGADGNGFLTSQSGAFNNMPYSFKTRFENDEGTLGTNPEELIAAAHAGCFNMKLSFVLNEADYNPEELNTDAVLTFEDGKVISIELNLNAKIPGISEEKFLELGEVWWCESNRMIPINIFLSQEMTKFKYCIMTMNSKDVKVSIGPCVNLNNLAVKRIKRKSVQLVRKPPKE